MANIVFMDSFDNYSSSTSHYRWQGGITLTPNGRTGQGAIGGNSSIPVKKFDLRSTLCAGVAYKTTALSNYPIGFSNGISGIYANMCVFADGRIGVNAFDNWGDVWKYSTKTRLLLDTWYYLEFLCSHTAGGMTFECRINEEVVLIGTLTGHGYGYGEYGFTLCTLRGPGGGSTCIFDDVYCTEGEFLGDVHVYVIKPDGDSTPSQWVPSLAGAHYLMVDDTVPNTLDYLSTINLNDVDMVTLEDISVTGDIKGIQTNFIAQKSDAGISMFHGMYNINSTDFESTQDQYLSYMAWIQYYETYRKNPVTNDDFTNAEINAMTMGVKRIL